MLGALTGVICSRSGVMNIGIEGQLLLGAFVAAMVASASGVAVAGPDRRRRLAGGVVGALLAVFAIQYTVDQIILGVVLERPHPRPHRVPVRRPDGALRQHAELPADLQRGQDPAAGRHPDHRAGLLPGDDLPLPDLPGPGPGPGGPVQHPVGAAHPRGRRAPGRGRHRRHPGVRHPVPQRHHGGAWSRHRRRLPDHRLGRELRQGHVVRRGLHRARRDDLRAVHAVRRDRRRRCCSASPPSCSRSCPP